MTPEEVQDLIDQSIEIAITKHNRNASIGEYGFRFLFYGCFC